MHRGWQQDHHVPTFSRAYELAPLIVPHKFSINLFFVLQRVSYLIGSLSFKTSFQSVYLVDLDKLIEDIGKQK